MIRRVAVAVVFVLLLAAAAGFGLFVHAAALEAAPLPPADGIVVLTGGSNRIDQGLRLLAAAQAPRLLVSGVLPGTQIGTLARAAGVDPNAIAGRVTLGQSAISTRGNAEETVLWARRYDLHRLIVVTAFYHMPRALAELRRALPGTVFYASPVMPQASRTGAAGVTLVLLAKEYVKFLAVELDLPRAQTDRRPGEGLR